MLNTWIPPKGANVMKAVAPGDIGTAGVNGGEYFSLRDATEIVFFMDLEADADPPVIAFQQAKDAAGTGVKALNLDNLATLSAVDTNNPTAAETWNYHETINRSATVASYDTTAAGGTNVAEYRVVVRLHQDMIDGDNGFTHVRPNIAAFGGARTGFALMIATNRQYRGDDHGGI